MILTDRDREMLLLIASDQTYAEAGAQLVPPLAAQSVKNRLTQLRHEYGTQTTLGLFIELFRLNLLTIDHVGQARESAWVQRARANVREGDALEEVPRDTPPAPTPAAPRRRPLRIGGRLPPLPGHEGEGSWRREHKDYP